MTEETDRQVRVWDPVVRVLHWSLVVGVFSAWAVSDYKPVHMVLGLFVLAVVIIRIIWGFVGTRYARFSDFVRPPGEAIAYLKGLRDHTARRTLGHNAAGGWMIVALLVTLLIQIGLGLWLYALKGHGPLSLWIAPDKALAKQWGFLHEDVFFFLLCALVALHIGGVIVSSRAHGENLVKAMWNGMKRADD